MAYAFILCTGIMQFLVLALGDRHGKAIWRLCGDSMEIVQCKCNCHAVSAGSVQKSYNADAGSIQRLCGDGVVAV